MAECSFSSLDCIYNVRADSEMSKLMIRYKHTTTVCAVSSRKIYTNSINIINSASL